MGEIKQQTISGVKWSAIERFSIQGVTFLLGLVVARLLTPADYGLVGMVGIFFGVSQTLIDSGFGNALVRKPDRTEADYYTAFYFSLVASIFFALLLCFGASWIADFFKQPVLCPMTRVMSLNLIIGTIGMIPTTKLYVALDFKTGAKINFICAVASGVFGLILAFIGYGAWSLVWQNLGSNILRVVLVWFYKPCKLLFLFSRQSFKQLFGYGSKLAAANILHTVYSEVTTLAIGKFYTPAALGNYYRGTGMASLPINTVSGVVGKVTFPILSRIQEDKERLIKVYRSYISLMMIPVGFLCILLAALAKPLILCLLTDKWSEAIIFLQIYVFSVVFDPICGLNLNLLQVVGRSDLSLKLEVIKKTLAMLILICAIPFGVVSICISKVVYTQIAIILNTYYTGRLFGLGYWQQWKDFSPYLLFSVIACLPSLALAYLCPWHWVSLIFGTAISTVFYIYILCKRRDAVFIEHIAPVLQNLISKLPKKWRFSIC